MAPGADLIICDEAVSALDVSVKAQIINLLADLQGEFGTSMLFISHNLAVIRHISHRVAVIHDGNLIETASCDDLFAAPVHPYTRALLEAVLAPIPVPVPVPARVPVEVRDSDQSGREPE